MPANEARGMTRRDLIGQRFGKLLVVRSESGPGVMWACRCDCGACVSIRANHLLSGGTKSCGCIRSRRGNQSTQPEYRAWINLVKRCTDPTHDAYERYGGRGISVCDRWHEFELFLADMGPRPSDRHSIERIDNAKGYDPENCRWATSKEQSRNRRNNHLLTRNGETMCLSAWAERAGISPALLTFRLRQGWSLDRSLNTPSRQRKRHGGTP